MRRAVPDLLIVGTELEGGDGFALLDAIPRTVRPSTVFIASSGDQATRAFEYQALDYLVRPYSDRRLIAAFRRVHTALGSTSAEGASGRTGMNGDADAPGTPYLERIVVKAKDRMYLVRTSDVDWIEAAADYVHIYAGGRKHIIRGKIGDLEKRLDPARFVRVHRSAIVHIDRISELRPLYHGEYQIVLADSTHLTLSRSYRGVLSRHFVNSI